MKEVVLFVWMKCLFEPVLLVHARYGGQNAFRIAETLSVKVKQLYYFSI